MALKLSTVTEQKSLWRNLMALQSSRVCSHQQQRGLAPSATSKGTQTRLAQIPEHARFLMKRLVTDLKTFVQQVHHNTVAFPARQRKVSEEDQPLQTLVWKHPLTTGISTKVKSSDLSVSSVQAFFLNLPPTVQTENTWVAWRRLIVHWYERRVMICLIYVSQRRWVDDLFDMSSWFPLSKGTVKQIKEWTDFMNQRVRS